MTDNGRSLTGRACAPDGVEPDKQSQAKPLVPIALKTWAEMADDVGEIIACGERWKAIAATIGCTVQGYDSDFSAAFFTPDGNAIQIGPKFRAVLAQGMAARSGETGTGSTVGNSPVGNADAPHPHSENNHDH